ncbi:MAG: hypothetical protein AAFX50_01450 [Acidobacteriota bacterium]
MKATVAAPSKTPAPRFRRLVAIGFCLAFLPAGLAFSQDLGDQEIAPGAPLPVNSVTDGSQREVDMALAPDDDMVIVWRQDVTTVAARRLSADGALTPPADFQISADTTETKSRPVVCVDGAGNSVIAWQQRQSGGLQLNEVRVRKFDRDFNPLTNDVQASPVTTSSAFRPSVACAANGDYVVAWGDLSVRARRYAADGTDLGVLQVQTQGGLPDNIAGVQIAAQDNGDFVVVWSTTSDALNARRFSGDGVALDASPFEVASGEPVRAIGVDKHGESGDFIIAWNDDSNFGRDVKVQRYDSSAVPTGNTTFAQVAFTSPIQTSAAFSGPNGEVVVAWNPANGEPAMVQRLDAAMQPLGSIFELGPEGGSSNLRFGLEGKATDGELATAYQNFVPSQSQDVFARRFLEAIFADGFESGDTSEWTATIVDP